MLLEHRYTYAAGRGTSTRVGQTEVCTCLGRAGRQRGLNKKAPACVRVWSPMGVHVPWATGQWPRKGMQPDKAVNALVAGVGMRQVAQPSAVLCQELTGCHCCGCSRQKGAGRRGVVLKGMPFEMSFWLSVAAGCCRSLRTLGSPACQLHGCIAITRLCSASMTTKGPLWSCSCRPRERTRTWYTGTFTGG
jgi:hypothetical protein